MRKTLQRQLKNEEGATASFSFFPYIIYNNVYPMRNEPLLCIAHAQ